MKKFIITIFTLLLFGNLGVNAMEENFTQVRASHILVATEGQAKAIIMRLKNGEDFAKLAKEYSSCPSGVGNGGDLGYFGRNMMVKPFEDASFNLPVGAISEPVQTDFGWHVIKVVDKR